MLPKQGKKSTRAHLNLEILQNYQARARLIQAWRAEPKPRVWDSVWGYNSDGELADNSAPTRWMEWVGGAQERVIHEVNLISKERRIAKYKLENAALSDIKLAESVLERPPRDQGATEKAEAAKTKLHQLTLE